ncbi:hypothetical protein QBC43DRAFT_366635 [Cladorrhinum sp. PSN259]|nr:hypothetical protein QBC43DRAFT_366635 [Cladorrhinum sp. PSN259]
MADASLTLEGLPAELRIQIIHSADHTSLGALILASPVYYSQCVYEDRSTVQKALLYHEFRRELDALLEAVVALQIRQVYKRVGSGILESESRHTMTTSVRMLGGRRPRQANPDTDLSLEEMIELRRYHRHRVLPVVDRFVYWCEANLRNGMGGGVLGSLGLDMHPLTPTERLAIIQAIYRFQINGDIISFRIRSAGSPLVWDHDKSSLTARCLGETLGRWQLEQMQIVGCFLANTTFKALEILVQDSNLNKVEEIKGYLDPRANMHASVPSSPCSAFGLGPIATGWRRFIGEGGLDSHAAVMSLVHRDAKIPDETAVFQPTRTVWTSCTSHLTAVIFSKPCRKETPPMVWALMKGYTGYGPHLRDWGYLFWSDERIARMGGESLIARCLDQSDMFWRDDYRENWWLGYEACQFRF